MARKLRLEFPGAIYHVISRGDRREPIFRENPDRDLFLQTLADTCSKTEWVVQAYCLLPDHFHLVVKTPQANLIKGMKWFLGTYTTRFNRRHKISGHVFSGRYKSSMIGPEGGYLRAVCDHVHLNPMRARLLESGEDLGSYPWSSFPFYVAADPPSPTWLNRAPVLAECGLDASSSDAGEAYRRLLMERSRQFPETEIASIRRDWCFGDDGFRQELLSRIESHAHGAHFGPELQEASEAKARRIIDEELRQAVWTHSELVSRRKGDPIKIVIAQRLREETTVTLQWIANHLHMGTKTHLSHLLYWRRRGAKRTPLDATQGVPSTKQLARNAPGPPIRNNLEDGRKPRAAKTKVTASESPVDAPQRTILSTDPFEFDPRFD